jgi:hypothetical protein
MMFGLVHAENASIQVSRHAMVLALMDVLAVTPPVDGAERHSRA